MSASKPKSLGEKILASLVVGLLGGFVLVVIIPKFVCARYARSTNACVNNLRQMDAAKAQLALEKGLADGAATTENDLRPYLRIDSAETLPKCPAGGTYTVGRIGADPTCSIGTSAWPNNHELNKTNHWWTDCKAAYRILFGIQVSSSLNRR